MLAISSAVVLLVLGNILCKCSKFFWFLKKEDKYSKNNHTIIISISVDVSHKTEFILFNLHYALGAKWFLTSLGAVGKVAFAALILSRYNLQGLWHFFHYLLLIILRKRIRIRADEGLGWRDLIQLNSKHISSLICCKWLWIQYQKLSSYPILDYSNFWSTWHASVSYEFLCGGLDTLELDLTRSCNFSSLGVVD